MRWHAWPLSVLPVLLHTRLPWTMLNARLVHARLVHARMVHARRPVLTRVLVLAKVCGVWVVEHHRGWRLS